MEYVVPNLCRVKVDYILKWSILGHLGHLFWIVYTNGQILNSQFRFQAKIDG